MELYLIRHAEAVPLGEQGIDNDADRPLTERGIQQALTVGRGLKRRRIVLDRIATSPLVRARQTTEHLLLGYESSLEILVLEQLIPEGGPKKLTKALRGIEGERVGIVGHNPQFEDYLSWLIGSKDAQVKVAKAGVALVTFETMPGRELGTLKWLVTPEWFEEIGQ